jgi:hypothetical protein
MSLEELPVDIENQHIQRVPRNIRFTRNNLSSVSSVIREIPYREQSIDIGSHHIQRGQQRKKIARKSLSRVSAEIPLSQLFFARRGNSERTTLPATGGKNTFTDDYVGRFPWIYDKDIYAEYLLHEKSFFDIYQCILPTLFIGISVLSHVNIYNIATENGYFQVAFFFTLIGIISFTSFLLMKCAKNTIENSNHYLCQLVRRLRLALASQNAENFVAICGTLINGFVLYGRVHNGQCNSKNLWETQVLEDSLEISF